MGETVLQRRETLCNEGQEIKEFVLEKDGLLGMWTDGSTGSGHHCHFGSK